MCGIFGVLLGPKAPFSLDDLRDSLSRLFTLSESRGKEASGLAVGGKGPVKVLKSPVPATRMIRTSEYREILDSLTPNGLPLGPLAFIGHSRLVTKGHQADNHNNQPVTSGPVTGIHNGIIVNDEEIWQEHGDLARHSEVDTEAVMALTAWRLSQNGGLGSALKKALEEVEGAASVAVLAEDSPVAALATNTGSLYLCEGRTPDLRIFASEGHILDKLMESSRLKRIMGQHVVTQLEPGRGFELNLADFSERPFSFPMNTDRPLGRPGRFMPVTSTFRAPDPPHTDPFSFLKRCTRCILPETMPLIDFDEQGVCNYCRQYTPMVVKDSTGLEELLKKYRSPDGSPDCLAAFSGGRDSSYGLHLLKTQYDMHPVAMTYDWGMVTDLARRNQARVCGKLGVEHILISADIAKKRGNIRKNVKAWLKQPDLGMIPLFMAGDKQFFYWANKVGEQMGTEAVVFCVNPLEKTNFKIGFCRVGKGKNMLPYSMTFWEKMRLAFYYMSRYAKNPAYINGSVSDSVFAFFSSFFLKHDYIMLFDYIRWDEDLINELLIREYDWELAEDTKTTWRIGDGTAPFYNYIYYRLAGFTENDTFRSNQIREGVISRDQGLQLSIEDNKPRWPSIAEYLQLIDLDFSEVMERINSFTPIYSPPEGWEPPGGPFGGPMQPEVLARVR
ncbi:MAG: hypothetical protein D6E12_05190 [Desulfovibrio sp.]|nr:MAG: hypothetical protein D6E12_05190 [Desulfovibrio sp.]